MGVLLRARRRLLVAPPAGLIAGVAETTNAAPNFSLNPLALGAAVGDTMVVASLWEDDSPVATPGGWTNVTEVESPGHTVARWHIDKVKFTGTPPSSVGWSYAGANGVAYAAAIMRGVTTVGALTNVQNNSDAPGTFPAFPVTAGSKGALVFVLADGVSEDASGVGNLTNMAAVVRDTTPVVARAAMVGFTTNSVSTSFNTGTMPLQRFQIGWLPLE